MAGDVGKKVRYFVAGAVRGGGGDPGRPPFSSSSQPGVTGRALSVLSGEATEGTNRNDDRALVGGEEEAG